MSGAVVMRRRRPAATARGSARTAPSQVGARLSAPRAHRAERHRASPPGRGHRSAAEAEHRPTTSGQRSTPTAPAWPAAPTRARRAGRAGCARSVRQQLERRGQHQPGGHRPHAAQCAGHQRLAATAGAYSAASASTITSGTQQHAGQRGEGAAPAEEAVADHQRQVDDVRARAAPGRPTASRRTRSCVSQPRRSTSSRCATGSTPPKPCSASAVEDAEAARPGERGCSAAPARVGAQRSTFSASGLTMLVGVPLMKLTTLSNAAPKYIS